jgi:hypothetical protein
MHGTGPLPLIAGPGAGKTRTVTHRIAYLLEKRRARPDQILAVTFSVRAAGELRLRLAGLLGQDRAREVTAATFHSVCARLLREHSHLFGRVTEAASLVALTGRVEMLTLDAGNKGAGQRARVTTEPYCAPAYGLDVPPHHYYVSGGAVVHNSAKGHRGTAGGGAGLRGAAAAVLAVDLLVGSRGDRRGAAAVLRRRHPGKDRLILNHVGSRGGRETAGPSRFLYEAGLLDRTAWRPSTRAGAK